MRGAAGRSKDQSARQRVQEVVCSTVPVRRGAAVCHRIPPPIPPPPTHHEEVYVGQRHEEAVGDPDAGQAH